MHLVSRPDAWERWLHAAGVEFDEVHGMLVDQFAVASQAAMAGLGVALLPTFLIEAELARKDLVLAVDKPMESADNYYLAWPVSRDSYPPLEALRQWIQKETRGAQDRDIKAGRVSKAPRSRT